MADIVLLTQETMLRLSRFAIFALSIIFSTILLLGLAISWAFWGKPTERDIPSEEEVPSSLLISKANELPEVKAFRDRYGEPHVSVDRVYGLKVTYSIKHCEWKGEECVKDRLEEPVAALDVWMDNNINPQSIVLWCIDGDDNTLEDRIDHNIIERLKTDTDTCF